MSIGYLERHNEINESVGLYICPSGPIVAQIVGILDGDRERHLDHNRILLQRSVSVKDERIRTYMRVPRRPKSGTSIMMIVSGLHPIRTILSKHI